MISFKTCRSNDFKKQLFQEKQDHLKTLDDLVNSLENNRQIRGKLMEEIQNHIDTIKKNHEKSIEATIEKFDLIYQKKILKSILQLIADGDDIPSLEYAQELAKLALKDSDKPLPR